MDWLGLALLLATGLVVGVLMLAAYTAHVLTHPPRRAYAFALARSLPSDPSELRYLDTSGAERLGAPYESWTFVSRSLTLPVWDLQGCDPLGPTIILTHGWGDSRVVSLSRAPVLLRSCRRLILWDLPGHGEAPGTSFLGTHEVDDLLALRAAIGEQPGGVVLYGHSLGAGVSIAAAARLGPADVAGVIAEAPYRFPVTPARNVLRLAGLPSLFSLPLAQTALGLRFRADPLWWREHPGSRFDRATLAATVRTPLLVVHGEADAVCPLSDAREIATSAPAGRLFEVPEGGHVDLYTDDRHRPAVAGAVGGFLASCRTRPD